MKKLANEQKYALITGAAGGIGKALVNSFKLAGYFVIATDRLVCPDDLSSDYYIQADLAKTVTDEIYAKEIFKSIKHCLKENKLHALINNAAVQILAKTDDLTRDDWQTTLNVNLLAPFIWSQAFLNELELAEGSIVNISSIHARLTKKNFVAYATSKAALSGMTRAMAVDLGPRVRVNAIEPAAIETDMLLAGFTGKSGLYNELKAYHPIGKLGDTKNISELALFLTSENALFLHGSCIDVSGAIRNKLHDPDF